MRTLLLALLPLVALAPGSAAAPPRHQSCLTTELASRATLVCSRFVYFQGVCGAASYPELGAPYGDVAVIIEPWERGPILITGAALSVLLSAPAGGAVPPYIGGFIGNDWDLSLIHI